MLCIQPKLIEFGITKLALQEMLEEFFQARNKIDLQNIKKTIKKILIRADTSICSVAQACLPVCNPMDCSTRGSLFITSSKNLLKLKSTESVIPSNHLTLCCPLLLPLSYFPVSGSFQMSQFLATGGQIIGVSPSASILPTNIQN